MYSDDDCAKCKDNVRSWKRQRRSYYRHRAVNETQSQHQLLVNRAISRHIVMSNESIWAYMRWIVGYSSDNAEVTVGGGARV